MAFEFTRVKLFQRPARVRARAEEARRAGGHGSAGAGRQAGHQASRHSPSERRARLPGAQSRGGGGDQEVRGGKDWRRIGGGEGRSHSAAVVRQKKHGVG